MRPLYLAQAVSPKYQHYSFQTRTDWLRGGGRRRPDLIIEVVGMDVKTGARTAQILALYHVVQSLIILPAQKGTFTITGFHSASQYMVNRRFAESKDG
jgi:hypothetical protein